MPPGPKYFAEFVHFTDRGAQTMARIIANDLVPVVAAEVRRAFEAPSTNGKSRMRHVSLP
jgi:hypothetical protein